MKTIILKLAGAITFSLLSISTFAQLNWQKGGNNAGPPGSQPIIGTNATWNAPLLFHTNGVQRIRINENTGFTSGFVGIGTNNPLFQLHVVGNQVATGQGWTRGILMSNESALMWQGAPNTNLNYFMGHSSSIPNGNFYQGYAAGIGSGAPVTYSSTVFVGSNPSNGPNASTQIFKWLFVAEDGFERRLGVNTLNPARTTEIKSNISANWQLRLTHNNDAWVDFQARNTGNLNIFPQGGKTGMSLNADPTHTIDVNGDARIRFMPVAPVPQSIVIGQQVGGGNDRELKRLDFTGNPSQVLLGNGTWGTIPPSANFFNCSNPAALLPFNSRYNLNNYNFYFDDPFNMIQNNYVGIGHGCGTPLVGKLDVIHNMNTTNYSFLNASAAGRFINNDMGAGTKIGVRADAHGPHEAVGGLFTATSTGQFSSNTGVYSHAHSSPIHNAGGYFRANGTGVSCVNYGTTAFADGAAVLNYGINSMAINSDINYGTYSVGGGGNFNYGIYASAWGLNPTSVVWAGYFDGNVWIDGAGYVMGGNLITSDQQFKTNIDTITNASSIIAQLQPKSFFFDTLNTYDIPFSSKKQYGFIAQDVEPILPELVSQVTRPAKYDSIGNIITPSVSFKNMNYNAYIALLTKGMQEQKVLIDSLQSQITTLTNCLQPLITQLCGNNNMMKSNNQNNNEQDIAEILNTINVKLSNGDAIVLEQNVPNPFNENTSIKYYIPENINYAQIIFTDMQGRIIKTVDIKQTGHGQLKVYVANLSQGIYQYSILVDGKVIDTKKMVVEK